MDMAELFGKVCSYFTYQGCTTDSKSDACKQDDMAIYVVMTETKQLSPEQMVKIRELAGTETEGERVIFERNER